VEDTPELVAGLKNNSIVAMVVLLECACIHKMCPSSY
jgi:hypothetical protein